MRTATNRNSAWLFPGHRAGQPMRPGYLAWLLNEIGIPSAGPGDSGASQRSKGTALAHSGQRLAGHTRAGIVSMA
jgi:hypothetical protein